jgi:hypothetical protein
MNHDFDFTLILEYGRQLVSLRREKSMLRRNDIALISEDGSRNLNGCRARNSNSEFVVFQEEI